MAGVAARGNGGAQRCCARTGSESSGGGGRRSDHHLNASMSLLEYNHEYGDIPSIHCC